MNKLTLLGLPGELQNIIFFQHCDGLDRLILRSTCHRLREMIPQPDMKELIEAETNNPVAVEKDLLVCSECVKFRHRSIFRGNLSEMEMERGDTYADGRICVGCDVVLESHFRRYIVERFDAGYRVQLDGRLHVVCTKCRTLGLAGRDPARSACWRCWHAFVKQDISEAKRRGQIREMPDIRSLDSYYEKHGCVSHWPLRYAWRSMRLS
ncbi:hypothetical protein PG993_012532 [Apiospora rasikravindrae]|uniref:F-box domain-containing protein n=1 Tax=Apiospora rasikravindrae TaxID=990691 RepID=A0ABR1S2T9_9PEZI